MPRVSTVHVLAFLLIAATCTSARAADPAGPDALDRARDALTAGDSKEAGQLARRIVEEHADNAEAWLLLGLAESAQRKHAEALAAFDRVIKLDPKAKPEVYDLRGSEEFCLGQIAASLGDFDRYLAARPERRPYHWRRGISLYYAGQYAEGARQFAAYQAIDANDVENATWRFLCMARDVGVKAARDALLPIGHDPRVPMMQIYALFAGKATIDDVLRAARAGRPTADELRERLFYAELYCGLYCEATGDAAAAREHITRAAEQYPIGHYMYDVARVHAARSKAEAKRP